MQNIHQTISKGLVKKYFKSESVEFERVSPLNRVLNLYEKMNYALALDGSRLAQAVYYGVLSFGIITAIIMLSIVY